VRGAIKNVELIANISIVLVALVLGYVFVKRQFFAASSVNSSAHMGNAGRPRLPITGVRVPLP